MHVETTFHPPQHILDQMTDQPGKLWVICDEENLYVIPNGFVFAKKMELRYSCHIQGGICDICNAPRTDGGGMFFMGVERIEDSYALCKSCTSRLKTHAESITEEFAKMITEKLQLSLDDSSTDSVVLKSFFQIISLLK